MGNSARGLQSFGQFAFAIVPDARFAHAFLVFSASGDITFGEKDDRHSIAHVVDVTTHLQFLLGKELIATVTVSLAVHHITAIVLVFFRISIVEVTFAIGFVVLKFAAIVIVLVEDTDTVASTLTIDRLITVETGFTVHNFFGTFRFGLLLGRSENFSIRAKNGFSFSRRKFDLPLALLVSVGRNRSIFFGENRRRGDEEKDE